MFTTHFLHRIQHIFKCDVKLGCDEMMMIVPRNRFPKESLMRQGMSGGAMLYNGDFVGVDVI